MMRHSSEAALNAICPYYTMYPLDFPIQVLRSRRYIGGWVLDPFCGRGTTNFAARLLGLPTIGLDSSPVAVAIGKAKLAKTSANRVVRCAEEILREGSEAPVPVGGFWRLAYHAQTLHELCRMRTALLNDCRSDTRILLRAIILGALHGPLTRAVPSHFSNQSPRTFAPKPDYAVRFWKSRSLQPPKVDVLDVIRRRADRYLAGDLSKVEGYVALQDSKQIDDMGGVRPRWIITSPPYYGMRTYIPDQWIRHWFLGGPPHVEYEQRPTDLSHSSPEAFAAELQVVWTRLSRLVTSDASLVVRFGAINDRKVDPREIIRGSLVNSGWQLKTLRPAGSAASGKRQAKQFGRVKSQPRLEYDFYARLV